MSDALFVEKAEVNGKRLEVHYHSYYTADGRHLNRVARFINGERTRASIFDAELKSAGTDWLTLIGARSE